MTGVVQSADGVDGLFRVRKRAKTSMFFSLWDSKDVEPSPDFVGPLKTGWLKGRDLQMWKLRGVESIIKPAFL